MKKLILIAMVILSLTTIVMTNRAMQLRDQNETLQTLISKKANQLDSLQSVNDGLTNQIHYYLNDERVMLMKTLQEKNNEIINLKRSNGSMSDQEYIIRYGL